MADFFFYLFIVLGGILAIGGYIMFRNIDGFDYLEAMDDPDWGGK